MSNNLAINVTASDNFSVTFADLNKKAEAVTGTLGRGRAAQQEWSDSFGKSLASVSSGAERLAASLGLAKGPASALFSIGSAGSIAAGVAAAAVGVGMLTKTWSESGQEIDRTAHILGVSAQGLQVWREAARLAGGTAEGMTATIAQLGTTLQDSLYGRNPQAAMVMRYFGIGIARDAQGRIDTLKTMSSVFAAMNKIEDPLARRTFAHALGIPEESIYSARRAGSFLAQARASGAVMDSGSVASAVKTEQALTGVGQGARGIRNRVGQGAAERVMSLSQHADDTSAAMAREASGESPTAVEDMQAAAEAERKREQKRQETSDAMAREAAGGEVTINVTVPENSRVTATSNGPPVKVVRSMQTPP